MKLARRCVVGVLGGTDLVSMSQIYEIAHSYSASRQD